MEQLNAELIGRLEMQVEARYQLGETPLGGAADRLLA